MPLYEYVCPNCGKQFEKLSSISSKDSCLCICGEKAERIVSACSHKIYGYCYKNNNRKDL